MNNKCYHQGGMQRRLSARSSRVVESSRSGGGSDSELNHVTRTVPPKSEKQSWNDSVSQVLGCLLPHDFARLLVFPESEKDRLTKAVITSPLSEFDLANHYRLNPMATSHLSGG